jgi:outer membrane immunogenic protein
VTFLKKRSSKPMKKLLCTTAAFAALALAIPAQASIYNGPYLGVHVGHNNTKTDMDWTNIDGSGIDVGLDNGASGLEFGAVAGYRVKQDRFVFGAEVDGSLSNAKGTLLSYNDGVDAYSLEVKKRHSYAIGPRIGYLVTDNALAFIGADWARGEFEATEVINGVSASSSDNLNGFRFGGGIEAAATDAVSVRLDYQHTAWKTSRDADGGGGTISLDPTEDTARIGAIYSF